MTLEELLGVASRREGATALCNRLGGGWGAPELAGAIRRFSGDEEVVLWTLFLIKPPPSQAQALVLRGALLLKSS
jgi:hypothetical protein